MQTKSQPKVSSQLPKDPIQNMKLLAYALKPERKDEFVQFFEKEITLWLRKKNITARSWIAGNVLFSLVSDTTAWTGNGGIARLEQFIEGNWIDPQKLPDVDRKP